MALLKIFFVDLMAFVPEENGRQIRVLLPNTPPEDAHVPYFFYDRNYYKTGQKGIETSRLNVWQLGGEELYIPHAGSPDLKTGDQVAPKEDLPKENDTRFHWVTRISTLHRNDDKGHVQPNALGPSGSEFVCTRMKLDHGVVKAFQFSTVKESKEIYTYGFEFEDIISLSPKRALVNITSWEREIPEDGVTIKSNHFNGEFKREVTLKPENGEIHAVLANLGNRNPATNGNTLHFKYFYRLTHDWGDEQRFQPKRHNRGDKLLANTVQEDWPEILDKVKSFGIGDPLIDLEGCPQAILEP